MPWVNGLDDITAAGTDIAAIDAERGQIVYRGHLADELARTRSYEDVLYLLVRGQLPDEGEARDLRGRMATWRMLPDSAARTVDAMPAGVDMMNVLCAAVCAMSAEPENDDSPFRLAACAPTVVARRIARLSDREPVPPRADLAHVENYLYMLRGACANPAHVAALDAYFVMTAEHGLNASTFAARVAASTGVDIATALCAALSALKGPLHGGAPAGVLAMLDQIGSLDRAEVWVRNALARGERIMGFGHRVYRTRDPRARVLEQVVTRHAGDDPRFLLARELEKTVVDILREQKPDRSLYANVEYYAAVVFDAVGIPPVAHTATFSASRIAGWCAHIREQRACGRLIRPLSVYTGPQPAQGQSG